MIIEDNYIKNELYDALCTLHIEYNKVHWLGYDALSQHALHDLMIRTKPEEPHRGATAWYNIRPKNPTWHNDISSYCTRNGKFYEPKILPPYTFIYYMREAKAGGNLTFRNGSTVKPIANRLAYFPASDDHKVEQYTGNRVSIGIIPWPEIPEEIFECKLTSKLSKTLNRIWEIEDGTLT